LFAAARQCRRSSSACEKTHEAITAATFTTFCNYLTLCVITLHSADRANGLNSTSGVGVLWRQSLRALRDDTQHPVGDRTRRQKALDYSVPISPRIVPAADRRTAASEWQGNGKIVDKAPDCGRAPIERSAYLPVTVGAAQ
jgi:hypothetical protein